MIFKSLCIALLTLCLVCPVWAHNTKNREICAPTSMATSARSKACIDLIYKGVYTIISRLNPEIKSPTITKYDFYSEHDSQILRDILGEGFLGVFLPATNTIIVAHHRGLAWEGPVEQTIAHEISHAFQKENGLELSEIQARDVATAVWFQLFE